MKEPQNALRLGTCDILLLGTVAGFEPDAERVRAAWESHRPDLLALGVPAEDLAALDALRSDPGLRAELVPPDAASERLLELLGRFGKTRIPSPDLEVAFQLAKDAGVRVEALDLPDSEHADEYVRRVKVRHLWMHPRREKRLLARPFDEVADAYELAVAWDGEANEPKPLRAMERLREEAMAEALRRLSANCSRLLAVVPVARFAGVVAKLSQEA